MAVSEERKALLDTGFEKFSLLIEDGRETIADNEDAAYIAEQVAARYSTEDFGLYVIAVAGATSDLITEAYNQGYTAGTIDAAARIGGQLQAAGFEATAVLTDEDGNEVAVDLDNETDEPTAPEAA